MLVINDKRFKERAEIIREKGTNRSAFFRGEVDKYSWVDIGSSFLPSDIIAAYLFAQLECLNDIQSKRKEIWNNYSNAFIGELDADFDVQLPFLPKYASNNAHMYYLVCSSGKEREGLIKHLKADGILAVFHYLSLNKSKFYDDNVEDLIQSDLYTERLVRLPLYYEMTDEVQRKVINSVLNFYK
jgi:dTDP-4-amino-4,6-dideoxygalactose transaminase